jgi:N-acylneuraminate cytidylyltransferase
MNICVIPARGGSKRIPKKNIRDFNGKPIIAYSIDVAVKSNLFDRVIVSTDDSVIADIAKEFGAETPFMRPNDISGDCVGTDSVVNHAIQWVKKNDPRVLKYICCIYATAPFILEKYLLEGFNLLNESGVDLSFSITSFPFPVQRSIRINDSAMVVPVFKESILKKSQDIDETYHDAGQFYWGHINSFSTPGLLYSGSARPVFIPRYLVQDIDTEEDWKRAELMYQALKMQNFF